MKHTVLMVTMMPDIILYSEAHFFSF